jgi:hypothetical protein
VSAEASLILPDALFVFWETAHTNPENIKTMTEDTFRKAAYAIPVSFFAAAAVFGLKIEF